MKNLKKNIIPFGRQMLGFFIVCGIMLSCSGPDSPVKFKSYSLDKAVTIARQKHKLVLVNFFNPT